jgi:hypothetical protein
MMKTWLHRARRKARGPEGAMSRHFDGDKNVGTYRRARGAEGLASGKLSQCNHCCVDLWEYECVGGRVSGSDVAIDINLIGQRPDDDPAEGAFRAGPGPADICVAAYYLLTCRITYVGIGQ